MRRLVMAMFVSLFVVSAWAVQVHAPKEAGNPGKKPVSSSSVNVTSSSSTSSVLTNTTPRKDNKKNVMHNNHSGHMNQKK